MIQPVMDQAEAYRKINDYLRKPPQTKAQLYDFIWALTGERVPFTPVCKDHQSPYDVIWKSYMIDLPEFKDQAKRNLIALGPRNGQKTLSVAKLIVAEMLLKPNCPTIGMGAVLQQADRCYKYARRYMAHPIIYESGIIKTLLAQKMELGNGSSYEQVCATLSGVNSPHIPKLRVDEVELIKPEVLEEAKMMANSWLALTAHTLYISTRKFVDGMMEELIKKSGKRNYDIVTWCFKEVSEPCPETRRGSQKKIYEIDDFENPGETIVVEAWEGCGDCPLLRVCKGDLAHATGTVPIDDSIDEFEKLDRETFLAQKLCKTPVRDNMFYADFSQKEQVKEFDYNPEWPTDMCLDFTNGGESPTAVLIVQEDPQGRDWVFAALPYVRKPTERMAEEIEQFCKDMGITRFRLQIGDSAQQQEIRNLNSIKPGFFRIVPCKKIKREEGWPYTRRQVMDNAGRRKLFINPRYAGPFLTELLDARRSKSNPDDISAACEDHFLDAYRYRCVKLRGGGGEPNIRLLTAEPRKKDDSSPLIKESPPDKQPQTSIDAQIRRWMAEDKG